MRSTLAIIALQIATLLAAGYAALVAGGLNREAESAAERAAHHRQRAADLAGQGRYAAAAGAARRSATLARDPATVDAAHDLGDRYAALAVVAADRLPPPIERARLEDLAERLSGGEGPAHVAAIGLSAVLLRMQGNLVAAARAIEDAEAGGATSQWFDWQMGIIRLRQGRAEDARIRLEKLAREQPGFAPGLHRLGMVYLSTDQSEAAIGALQKAIEAGGEPDVSLDLARLFLGRQMWAEAIPHLQRVLRGRGGDVDALRLLAAAHFRLGRHDLAARTYRQAYRMDNDPRTLLSAAIALGAGGKQGEALAVLDTLMPRVGELPEVAWQRGRILLDLGRVGEGRATLERYMAAAAGRPEEAERMAEVRRLLGGRPTPTPTPNPNGPAPTPSVPAPPGATPAAPPPGGAPSAPIPPELFVPADP